MPNEDELKRRRMEQMMAEQQLNQMTKALMLKILDKGARERLSTIRSVKPDVAAQLELYLMQLYQTGQLRNVVTEEQLKQILYMMQKKPNYRIIKK